jgi:hypothetical protein
LLLQLRKAAPILVRMRVSHGARPAAACSVSLRCHQSRDTDRTLLDDMETVFVLIAFRRFAQFSGNQRKRTDSGDEKACGYDHDANRQARFAPLPVGSTLSYRQAISRLSIRQSYQWGNARRKLTCAFGEFFPQTGLAEFLSAQSVRFWTVLSGS